MDYWNDGGDKDENLHSDAVAVVVTIGAIVVFVAVWVIISWI